jgi:hypothetical protein
VWHHSIVSSLLKTKKPRQHISQIDVTASMEREANRLGQGKRVELLVNGDPSGRLPILHRPLRLLIVGRNID